jgi:hypothetical protein
MALAISDNPLDFGPFRSSQGVSEDADETRNGVDEIWGKLYEEVATENHRREVLEDLDDSREEYSSENWDGYGAKPINAMSYYYAHRFLESLSPSLPSPEVGVDPDGEVSFEWYRKPRQVFSISVAPNGDLNYAGLFGRNKVHGTESFDDETPKVILDNLRRLFTC